MYKKQMKLQKAICLLLLVACVLVFLYSLGIMTDLYDGVRATIHKASDPTDTRRNKVAGAFIYYDMQDFNRQFLHVGLALLLLSLLLFITNTHVRRRYYIGNVIAVAINAIAGLAAAIWAHAQIMAFRAQYLLIDFEALAAEAEKDANVHFTDSTFWFDIHYAIFGLVLLANVLLIANLIWKFRLMKEEKQLIEAGKGAAA